MIEQSLQSHHTPISHIFKTLNPVESFSPLPLQYHIIFAIKLTAPPPYTTSFPNGKNAKPANLKHCKPIGIPIMEMHHRQPAKTHDSPLNNPPHINQSIFPNMLISIFLLYLSIYSIVNWCSYPTSVTYRTLCIR